MMDSFSNKRVEDVYASLHTGSSGLSQSEAETRLGQQGYNELKTKAKVSPFIIFISQFKNFIIYILLFAVFFALLIGEWVDSIIILAILLSNALIGFIQELSAQRSLEALKKLTALSATVFRDGRKMFINARELVVGDLIYLEAGDKVPADARVVEAVRLKIEEAALTGESVPAEKNNQVMEGNLQLGDQHNMVFMSTSVVTGNCRGVVVATGMDTEIGKITELVSEAGEEMTPLQRRLHEFGKKLGAIVIAICCLVFAIFALKEIGNDGFTPESIIAFVFIAISLAVAAVPTALPAVVTIALSVGVKRLLAKKALVRTLSSVETLGSCDVICTDKTGTLTKNQMTVVNCWTLDGEAALSGTGYAPEGEVSELLSPLLFQIGAICNNGELVEKEEGWEIVGDPTEGSLLTSAAKAGVTLTGERRDELPFDSDRKLMSVLVEKNKSLQVYSKGAPNQLLACCPHVLTGGEVISLTPEMKEKIERQNDHYASQAMRVLAFAYKPIEAPDDFTEENLVFVGLQAMMDPPREDVIRAIATTKDAGIRVIMITGDYQATAQAIGKEIGIEGQGLSGEHLEMMDEEGVIHALENNTNIFSRVVPEHKQRIVSALQKLGHTVAMTGDGVNDAPALKKANIGIAVGSGTEVAKEASDFILLDDSFSHIVNAIKEGRGIYDNIQKSIMLLLSGNIGEVLIIFIAAILGMNLPLTAILLLWINMITDGAPALAYSVDPYGKGIMRRQPKPRDESILPRSKLTLIGVLGCVGTVIALVLFSLHGGNSSDGVAIIIGQTMVFNFVVLYEVVLTFIIRRDYQVPLFSNKWVWASAVFALVLQALLMYTPMHSVFKIAPLRVEELGMLVGGGILFFGCAVLYQSGVAKIRQ